MTKYNCAQLYIWRILECANETIYGEIELHGYGKISHARFHQLLLPGAPNVQEAIRVDWRGDVSSIHRTRVALTLQLRGGRTQLTVAGDCGTVMPRINRWLRSGRLVR